MVSKMIAKILNIPNSITDLVDLMDIEYNEEFKTFKIKDAHDNFCYMFKLDTIREPTLFEDNQLVTTYLQNQFTVLENYEGLNFVFTAERFNEGIYVNFDKTLFNKWLEEKNKQFKNHYVYKGYVFTLMNEEPSKELLNLIRELGYSGISEEEAYSYLYRVFNKKPQKNYELFASGEQSLIRSLYDSHFIDDDGIIEIGGHTYVKPVRITNLRFEFNINQIIEKLAKLDIEFDISVSFVKNNEYKEILEKKYKKVRKILFANKGNNRYIEENLEKFLDYLNRNNDTVMVNEITLYLFSDNKEKLQNIELKLSDTTFMWENFYAIESYFKDHIFKDKLTYTFLSSTYESILLQMFPHYKINPYNIYDTTHKDIRAVNSFDYSRKDVSVNSSLIAAQTGSGKSVLFNDMLRSKLSLYKDNLYGLLVDYGGSYNKLYEYLKKEEVDISYLKISSQYTNLFDLEYGIEITEKILRTKVELIKKLFGVIFELSEEEKLLLDNSVYEVYKNVLFGHKKKRDILNEENVDYFWDTYLKNGDKQAFLKAMPTLNDLIYVIGASEDLSKDFSEEVRKGFLNKLSRMKKSASLKYLINTSSDIFTDKILIVDFDEILMENTELSLAYLVYFTFMSYLKFLRLTDDNPDSYKMFIIDEYERFREVNKNLDNMIDLLLKTGRKESIDTFLVVQALEVYRDDFVENIQNLIVFPGTDIKQLAHKLKTKENNLKFIEKIKKSDNFREFAIFSKNSINKFDGQTFRFELNDFEKEIYLK